MKEKPVPSRLKREDFPAVGMKAYLSLCCEEPNTARRQPLPALLSSDQRETSFMETDFFWQRWFEFLVC